MEEIKNLLLMAPDSQLDASMKKLIENWTDPEPTALQVLEVLDHCIFASLASGFTVTVLQTIYDARLRAENTTHEALVPRAKWRESVQS